jgi:hypothetical protein
MKIKKIIEKKDIEKFIESKKKDLNIFVMPTCCFTSKVADIWIIEDNEREQVHPCNKEFAISQGWIEELESNAD